MSSSKIQPYHGDLFNYRTGESIRAATRREKVASEKAASEDGGAGVIVVDGIACVVKHGGPLVTAEPDPEPEHEPEPVPVSNRRRKP